MINIYEFAKSMENTELIVLPDVNATEIHIYPPTQKILEQMDVIIHRQYSKYPLENEIALRMELNILIAMILSNNTEHKGFSPEWVKNHFNTRVYKWFFECVFAWWNDEPVQQLRQRVRNNLK